MLKRVVFSERAFVSILVETQENIQTETGGVFLGFREDNEWYVIESIDPGPNSIFKANYFEYDQDYVNHLINKISRLYDTQLDLIGLWHRHPGSFDSFSRTDDETNTKYAELNNKGAISALVNIDPKFRLTVYSVTLPLEYKEIEYIVGNSYIPMKLLQKKNIDILQKQLVNQKKRKFSKIFFRNKYFKEETSTDKKAITGHFSEKEYTFYEVLFRFLQQRTYDDIKNPLVELSDENDEQVLLILEKLEDDMSFLSSIGVEYQISISPIRSLVLREIRSKENTTPGLELSFGSKQDNILFFFNECCYKYYSGLFKDAYIEYAREEGNLK